MRGIKSETFLTKNEQNDGIFFISSEVLHTVSTYYILN